MNIEHEFDWSSDPGLEELEELSNRAVDLIEGGQLDEAERVCSELRRKFPDQIDGFERTAAVDEARGRVDQAITNYRRCLDMIDRDPDGFDDESRAWYQSQIDRLRPRLGTPGAPSP
jgi:predicted Zn-dependent protease